MTEPLVIAYVNLLKKHGDPDSPEIVEFLERHKDNKVFQERAKTLRKIYVFEAFAGDKR